MSLRRKFFEHLSEETQLADAPLDGRLLWEEREPQGALEFGERERLERLEHRNDDCRFDGLGVGVIYPS